MKKSKLLKSLGFASLALFMAATGVFAFAPLGASSASLANASESEMTTTSGLGLDPKNDPVVYTTESGLEIRMSNATKYSGTTTVTTNRGYSYTQDLSSFYYFTMGTFSGTIYTAANNSTSSKYSVTNEPVNWIILGLGPNTGYFFEQVAANLFSTWKTNTSTVNSDYTNNITANGPYFFQEVFESTTPAGSAINAVVPSKSYVIDKVKASITTNDEIPDGCMLVISEKLLGQMYFNGTGTLNQNIQTAFKEIYILYCSGQYGNRYRYYGNKSTSTNGGQSWTTSGNVGGSLYNHINSMFSKNNATGAVIGNSLGFTQAQADLIVPQQLYTYYSNGSGYNYQETPTTDGNTYYTMFPLAYRTTYSSIYQNFCIEDYLPDPNQRISCFIGSTQPYVWWLRSAHNEYSHYASSIGPSGSYCFDPHIICSYGVRPAMVMKLK